jgi:putative chitinase
MKFTEQIGRGRALRDINIRKGAPSVFAPIFAPAPVGRVLDFVGFVSDGEKVGGSAKWFKTAGGNYFWSGNIEVLPELSPPAAEGYKDVSVAALRAIAPGIPASTIAEFANALNVAMKEFFINTPLRQCAFIAQTAHESVGYTVFTENLNYSAKALLATCPKRFTEATAGEYAMKPEKIANKVYANRLGNSTEASGDGWRY